MRAAALLLTTLAMLAGGCGSAAERTVELTIRHSRFDPPMVEVAPGERVRFVIRNLDPIDHEFILGDAEAQRRHEDGTEPHHGLIPGEVSVPAVAERSTTFEFGDSGTLLFGCHLPGHWSYGMRGTVRVG